MKALVRSAMTAACGSLAILLCALSAHAAAYRSFWPSDGVHGYFGWYEPLVAILSGAAVVVVIAFLLLGLHARGAAPSRRQRTLLAWLRPWRGSSLVGGGLAAAALGFLLIQETVERSLSLGRFALASFPASTWLIVLASVTLVGALLTFLARWCTQLVEIILGGPDRRGFSTDFEPPLEPRRPAPRRRPNPLATGLGMRAPPDLLLG
jgi:hypothetical protein